MLPLRIRRGWAWVLLALVGLAGCHWGGPPAPPAPAGREYLVDPQLELVARELVRRAQEDLRPSVIDTPRRVLLAPLAPGSRDWDGAVLAWAILRHGPNLTPQDASVASVPALQGWLRGEGNAQVVAWMLELRDDDAAATVELVVASSEGVWRSGEVHLPPRSVGPASLELTPLARAKVSEPADALRLDGTTLWLESRWGRREIRLRGDRLELGDLRGWSDFDRSWTERPAPPAPAVPTLYAPSGDRRLELRSTVHDDHTLLRWWVARAGGSLALAAPIPVDGRWLALETWPSRLTTWIVLSETPRALELTALHLPLRAAPSERSRPGAGGDPPPVWAEGGPADPTGWPRDRWSLWVRAHTGVSLSRQLAGEVAARPEPDIEFTARAGGKVWDVDLPSLSGRQGMEPVTVADWTRALTARLEGSVPVGYQWLTRPLAGKIHPTSRGVRLEFDHPVPDLIERLAHPVLALDDPVLARRFATHWWRTSSLRPWHRGPVVELRAEVPKVLEPALRRLPLDQLGVDPGDGTPESTLDAVLLCSAAAPVELRRRLAWALRGVDAADLLALDDPALTPAAPASRRPLTEIWRDALAPSGPAPRVGFLPVAAADDPDGELSLAQRRLEILLPERGIEIVPAGASHREGVVLAQLVRIALSTGEPLLRVSELGSWAGVDPADLIEAATWPLDAERRRRAAAEVERGLLLDGALVPLWSEPGRTRVDASLEHAGPWLQGLPAMCWEARSTRSPGRGADVP